MAVNRIYFYWNIRSAFNFVYKWSGQNIIFAPFSAVNESIFEHMKILFFPMLIFALIESYYLKEHYENFWGAKLLGILFGVILIPILYYTYTGILGFSVDWFNIVIFFIADASAYFLENYLLKKKKVLNISNNFSLLMLIIVAIAFITLTFNQPKIPLFEDPRTGIYGLGQ